MDSAPDAEHVPDSFHFVTDIYFLTMVSVHVGYLPCLAQHAQVMRGFQQWIQQAKASGKTDADLLKMPNYRTLDDWRLGFEALLFNDPIIELLTNYYALTR